MKDINFLLLTDFKLLRKIKVNSINISYLVSKLIISVTGGHCGYTSWESKTELRPGTSHLKFGI